MAESVVVRRLHASSLEPDVGRSGALSHNSHLAARHDIHRLKLHPFPQAADGAGGVRDRGGSLWDGGHLAGGNIEESLNILRPGSVARCGAGGAEGGGEPGVGNDLGGVRRGGHAGESEDVAGVDGAGVDGVCGGAAVRGVHAGVLVGEYGDAGAGATEDDAAGLEGGVGGGGGGDVAGDGCGSGVVFVDAEVNDVGDGGVGAEVRNDGVLELLAEAVSSRKDLESAVGGHWSTGLDLRSDAEQQNGDGRDD